MKSTATAARSAGWGRLCPSFLALAALVAGLVLTVPAHAMGPMNGAEKLRRLDIMLMVTGLRCRTGADNFTDDYGAFTTSHLQELNDANAELKAYFAQAYGDAVAQRELDHLSTIMANEYGEGHPWLTCANLKMVAHNLAQVRGRATLEEAADQLLAPVSPVHFALAQR